MRFVSTFLAAAVCLAGAAAAQSPASPQAVQRVYDCRTVADDAERLACFDETVSALHQAESSGEVLAVDRAQVATVERDSFGFSLPSLTSLVRRARPEAPDGPDSIEMVVERIVPRGNGHNAFMMAGGQVWIQVDVQRTSNVRPGDTVNIRRAALGSFRLVSPRGGAGHRVRRES